MMILNRRRFLTLGLPALGTVPLFAQAGGDKPQLRFGVIADPQYADAETKGTRHYRASLAKLETAVTELNRHELDFVITLGDLIDRDFASFGPVLERYARLKAPHRIVLGNHDFDMPDTDKPRVLETLGLVSGYASHSHKRWRVLMIDGTEVSTYRYAADDARTAEAKGILSGLEAVKAANAQPWNGGIGARQLSWLEAELSAAAETGQRVIVAGHFPLLPADDPHRLWNADEVVKTIGRHPQVAAYLNGHNHKGNYAREGGCHYVNFKGMVETAEENAYAIVSCYEGHIRIDGYGPEPSREKLD